MVLTGQKVSFDIVHFSGYDVGNARLNELINVITLTGAGEQAQQNLVTAYLVSRRTDQDPAASYTSTLHCWYMASVRTLLQQGAASDSVEQQGQRRPAHQHLAH